MNKENMVHVYTCNRILLSHKKRRKLCLYKSMSESEGHYIKGNKPGTERQIPRVFTYTQNLNKMNS